MKVYSIANKLKIGYLGYSVDFTDKSICMLDNLSGQPRNTKNHKIGSLYCKPIDLANATIKMNDFISTGDKNNKGFFCAVLRHFIGTKMFHDKLDKTLRNEILDAVKLYY